MKTAERIIAKQMEYEYKLEPEGNPNCEFWQRFSKLAEKNGLDHHRYNFRIYDYARVSALFTTVEDLLKGVVAVKENFDVVGLKNGFRGKAPPSGYRDLKLLVTLETDKTIIIRNTTWLE